MRLSKRKQGLIEKGILLERFFVAKANPFECIIINITRECDWKVANCGIVGITASSVLADYYNTQYIADLTDVEHDFESKNEANQWIEWDFKTAHIESTHHSIRKYGYV
jgi:hypothetical protein